MRRNGLRGIALRGHHRVAQLHGGISLAHLAELLHYSLIPRLERRRQLTRSLASLAALSLASLLRLASRRTT